ncbi:hypothetical protein T09_11031 [Trichinella sp. T9]|nr:hypothetical protein T09_11031 [Trichinella sp. T9]
MTVLPKLRHAPNCCGGMDSLFWYKIKRAAVVPYGPTLM